jgi:hypothetical protein
MKFFLCLSMMIFSSFTVFAWAAGQKNQVQTIVLFRHAEKPGLDVGQLNCQGLNRALALPKVLVQKFGSADAIFAPYPYGSGLFYYIRGILTAQPTAIALGMPIQTDFYLYEVEAAARYFLAPEFHHATLFVAWEHVTLEKIARKMFEILGRDANLIPHWSNDDFDSLYVIKIDWREGKPQVSFVHDYQHLNNQAPQCLPAMTEEAQGAVAQEKTFFLVPVAESLAGVDQLRCQGLNRALALVNVLGRLVDKVDVFMLPIPDKKAAQTNYIGALTTIAPTLIKRGGISIPTGVDEASFWRDQVSLAHTIVIVLPFAQLTQIAQLIYVKYGGDVREIPQSRDEDVIYQIKLVQFAHALYPVFSQLHENLDNQAKSCP